MHVHVTTDVTPQELALVLRADARRRQLPLLALCVLCIVVFFSFPLLTFSVHGKRAPASVILTYVAGNPLFWILFATTILLLMLMMRAGNRKLHLAPCAGAQPCSWDITPEGLVCYCEGRRVACYSYALATALVRHGGFFAVMHRDWLVAVFPLRCFASEADVQAAEQLLRQGVAEGVTGHWFPPLTTGQADCLWRFNFMFDRPLYEKAAAALPRPRRATRWHLLALLGFAACLFAGLIIMNLPGYFYYSQALFLLAAFCGAYALHGLLTQPPRTPLPQWFYGLCVLEIAPEEVRIANETFEHRYTWAQITAAVGAPGIALIMAGSELAAPLPYTKATFDTTSAALDYVQSRVAVN